MPKLGPRHGLRLILRLAKIRRTRFILVPTLPNDAYTRVPLVLTFKWLVGLESYTSSFCEETLETGAMLVFISGMMVKNGVIIALELTRRKRKLVSVKILGRRMC